MIEIGRVMKNQRKTHKFFLSLEDLERHMFVCGASQDENYIWNSSMVSEEDRLLLIIPVFINMEVNFLKRVLRRIENNWSSFSARLQTWQRKLIKHAFRDGPLSAYNGHGFEELFLLFYQLVVRNVRAHEYTLVLRDQVFVLYFHQELVL
jgi:hypothetical protein